MSCLLLVGCRSLNCAWFDGGESWFLLVLVLLLLAGWSTSLWLRGE